MFRYQVTNHRDFEDHLLPDVQTMEEVFALEDEAHWQSPRGIYTIGAMVDY